MNALFGEDILTAEQFDKKTVDLVMKIARKMQKIVEKKGSSDLLKGKLMTALFYEPSSRTYASFISAMQRLGGGIIPIQGVQFSSVTKGETLADTVRTFESYSDVVVLRHPEVGSAKIAADSMVKPLINAGDGVGEHPTQALLDFFTIQNNFSKIDGLHVTMVGDLLNGRTIHSLSKLLSLYPKIHYNFISPDILRLPDSLKKMIQKKGVSLFEGDRLEEVLPTTDVLYVTRVQKERFSDLDTYEKLKHHYVITPTLLRDLKKKSIIMHPLPRVGEISPEVDTDKRALYISEQMKNGMYVRMALLALVLKKDI
ncbi:MAG: aspartate carbamoyltransferase [Candidatus Woesebacteria bacterium]